MGVLPSSGGGQVNFEEAHRFGADVAEEQVPVVVNRSAGDVLRRLAWVMQQRDFLTLERGWVQTPNDSLALRAVRGHGVIHRVTPARRDEIQLPVSGKNQPATVINERIFGKRRVELLRGGSKRSEEH